MSHEATELCQLLVDEIYGELTTRIFSSLTHYGRLTFSALALRSHLSSRQLKHGLAVLIQQNLAFWSTTAQGTFYEADWRGAYNLVRRGKLISIVEGRHGKAAGEIVSTLLILGHATVNTLLQAQKQWQAEVWQSEIKNTTQATGQGQNPTEDLDGDTGTNGTLQGEERKLHQAHSAVPSLLDGDLASASSSLAYAPLLTEVSALVKNRLLCAVHESHFKSKADTLLEAEREISAHPEFKGKPNIATKVEFRDAVDQLLFSWQFGSNRRAIPKTQAPLKSPRGKKRALSPTRTNGASKRARVTSTAKSANRKHALPHDHEITESPKKTRLSKITSNGSTDSSLGPQNRSKTARWEEEHNDTFDGYESDSEEKMERIVHVDENTVLDVDHAQLGISLRNEHLVQFVQEQIGAQTAQVYASFLRLYEKYLHSCSIKSSVDFDDLWDLRHGPGVLTRDIAKSMTEVDASNYGIGPADPSQINIKSITHAKKDQRFVVRKDGEVGVALSDGDEDENEDDQELSDFIENDNDEEVGDAEYRIDNGSHHSDITAGPSTVKREAPMTKPTSSRTEADLRKNGKHKDAEAISHQDSISVNGIPPPPTFSLYDFTRQHMLILAEYPCQLVTYVRGKQEEPERWTVDFDSISRHMRLSMLEEIVQDRYGVQALRIVRILQLKGKLDEKGLSSFSLMNPKSMRSILTAMHEGGHLELQEIPRDNNRQPVKTMFYWFFDDDRCRRKVLEESYKTMANCLRRIKLERETVQAILDKANRLDVQGREEEFLNPKEQAEMQTWRQKEDQLLGQLARLDDLVGVLRDF